MVINMSELFTVDGTVKTYEVPLEMSEVVWKRKKYPIVSKQPVELRLTHEGDRKIAITAKESDRGASCNPLYRSGNIPAPGRRSSSRGKPSCRRASAHGRLPC